VAADRAPNDENGDRVKRARLNAGLVGRYLGVRHRTHVIESAFSAIGLADYQRSGAGIEPAIAWAQFNPIEEGACRRWGVVVVGPDDRGFEADDALASGAANIPRVRKDKKRFKGRSPSGRPDKDLAMRTSTRVVADRRGPAKKRFAMRLGSVKKSSASSPTAHSGLASRSVGRRGWTATQGIAGIGGRDAASI